MKPGSKKPALLLSVEQFCQTYGLSRTSIYRMAKNRQIPTIRVGPKGCGLKLEPTAVLKALERPAKPKAGVEK
ncbi:MAG: helix-turn-helix domain-containing protein [Nitrospira sp.]|nr:helix-turn-helix domain-containing protein [Nitrospira sp.]